MAGDYKLWNIKDYIAEEVSRVMTAVFDGYVPFEEGKVTYDLYKTVSAKLHDCYNEPKLIKYCISGILRKKDLAPRCRESFEKLYRYAFPVSYSEYYDAIPKVISKAPDVLDYETDSVPPPTYIDEILERAGAIYNYSFGEHINALNVSGNLTNVIDNAASAVSNLGNVLVDIGNWDNTLTTTGDIGGHQSE